MEQTGVFDTEAKPGIDKAPKPADLKPFDAKREGISEGDKNKDTANKIMKVLDYLKRASEQIETASAYVPTIAGGAKQSMDRLYQARQYITAAMGDMRVNLIKMVDKDPTLKDIVTKWLDGEGSGQMSKDDIVLKPTEEPSMPEALPEAPEAPEAKPAAEMPEGSEKLPAPPPEEPSPKKSANESFLRKLEKAIAEDGVTKERKQTKKRKKLVWQPEDTGTKTDWATKGVKGHGYGSGGRFNDH